MGFDASILLRPIWLGLAALSVSVPVLAQTPVQLGSEKSARTDSKTGAASDPRPSAALLFESRTPTGARSLGDAPREKLLVEELLDTFSADRGGPPPANDNCENAAVIMGTGMFPFDLVNATTDGPAHPACNFLFETQIDRDIWYLWTAPASASYVVSTCGGQTGADTRLALYSPGCPVSDATLLQCSDDACFVQAEIVFAATMGQQFLIRLGVTPFTGGGSGTFSIELQPGQDFCGQPAPNCQAGDNTDAFDSSGFFVFDDFRVDADASVSSICFAGAITDTLMDCGGTAMPEFTVAYYLDFFGRPSEAPFATFFFDENSYTGPIDTGERILDTFPVYEFVADHAPVNLLGGRCYWVRITMDTMAEGCNFFWRKGSGGNDIAFQALGEPPFANELIATDLDFCLDIALGDVTQCQSAEPPENDDCANALVLNNGFGRSFSNIFATTVSTDPDISCRAGGPFPAFGSVWYTFQPDETSARISLCRSLVGDTVLAVYEGTCGSFVEIGCNDDFCSLRSQVTLTGLTPGQTYYVQVGGLNSIDQSFYEIVADWPAPQPPAFDVCSGAIELTVPPGGFDLDIETNEDATLDTDAPSCGFLGITAPGIWYRVEGTGETMEASLCNTTGGLDTKINVYCGSCEAPICVASNDDDCGLRSRVEWCSEMGADYYILVYAFDGQVGTTNLVVSSDGVACATPPDCSTCTVTCPPGAIVEMESCGMLTNDGCNVDPPTFETIACGQTVCGTTAGVSNDRDTDFYRFDLGSVSRVTWSAEAELPVQILLLNGDCDSPEVFAEAIIDRCGSGQIEAILPAGTYFAFIANELDGFPCGTSNNYVATLNCEPLGACCSGNDCDTTTAADCAAAGGTFLGAATGCPIEYVSVLGASPFLDISISGTLLPLNDDDGAFVDIGFPFEFYGVTIDRIGISSEGYLSAGAPLDEAVNAPIPTAALPNALIAALWDDLSLPSGGAIYYQTIGVSPSRQFIAQWDAIPQPLEPGTNTFQAVLYEADGAIELRYLTIKPEASAGDYTIGIENFDGSAGTSIDAATLVSDTEYRFEPSLNAGLCVPAACNGAEVSGDGEVNFGDITYILQRWLNPGPDGDADGNGSVGFSDITRVLQNWLCTTS